MRYTTVSNSPTGADSRPILGSPLVGKDCTKALAGMCARLCWLLAAQLCTRGLCIGIGFSPQSVKRCIVVRGRQGEATYDATTSMARVIVDNIDLSIKKLPIKEALEKIGKDMQALDNVVGRTPQLSLSELVVLCSTVLIAGSSPFFLSPRVVELLVPSMAAVSAAIGISAEYVGKVAVANGKEVAALAIQASAEAEVVLATAERTKAILPVCVGISTTATAFAMLAPPFVYDMSKRYRVNILQEVYLLCPLAAVLAAAVAGLAAEESSLQCAIAAGRGIRRFASSKTVGRNWLSVTEQVDLSSDRNRNKWASFSSAVFIAPVVASLVPGVFSFKAIVCATVGAAQAAYYLASAEYALAAATEAVSLKTRAAAIADTYANQGSRAGAILPFTSALAGLCAAASAAAVELLPMVSMVEMQALIALVFPTGAALFASAAAVSKARCEVDAQAASTAAATGLSELDREEYGRDPTTKVLKLMRISLATGYRRIKSKLLKAKSVVSREGVNAILFRWRKLSIVARNKLRRLF